MISIETFKYSPYAKQLQFFFFFSEEKTSKNKFHFVPSVRTISIDLYNFFTLFHILIKNDLSFESMEYLCFCFKRFEKKSKNKLLLMESKKEYKKKKKLVNGIVMQSWM